MRFLETRTDDDPRFYLSAEGWKLTRCHRVYGAWNVQRPDGSLVYGDFPDVDSAIKAAEAEQLTAERDAKRSCPFCGAGPEDDDTDECMLRGLPIADAQRLAESREARIRTLQDEVDALHEYIALTPAERGPIRR